MRIGVLTAFQSEQPEALGVPPSIGLSGFGASHLCIAARRRQCTRGRSYLPLRTCDHAKSIDCFHFKELM